MDNFATAYLDDILMSRAEQRPLYLSSHLNSPSALSSATQPYLVITQPHRQVLWLSAKA